MANVEIALLMSLLVVLVQAFCEFQQSSELEDDVFTKSTLGGGAILGSHDC